MKAVLFLLLFSPELLADCSWTPRESAQFRTTALDVATDGDFVWVATGYGVQLLEKTRIADSVSLPSLTRAVRPSGSGFAYAGSGSRVYALRRDGRKIVVAGSATASGTVNALAIAGTQLFVATSGGIDHFDLLEPANPSRRNSALPTSAPNVLSLAASPTTLFAADADASVEMFSISIPSQPQSVGALEAMPRASAVHVIDGLLYVSDAFGQSTEVFSGISRVATLRAGANSLAPLTGRIHLAAGPDRTIRAIDFASPDRITEYLELQLAPTGGTDNAIHAMARAGNTLYVAAGDVGLVTVDLSSLTKPFPLVHYTTGPTSSVRVSANKAWVSDFGGGLSELRLDPTGLALIEERKWTGAVGSTVRDARDNGLLTSAERDLTLWALVSATPSAVVTAKLVTDIVAAVSADAYAIALLSTGSVYTVRTASPTPERVTLPPMSHLARSGSAIAMAEIQEADGKTVLHYWPTGDLSTEARKITVDGAAVGNIALEATRAALFTFNGISVVDLASGNVRVIPNSTVIPRQLAFSGDDLLALDGGRLHVFANAQTLVREQRLPAETVAFDVVGTLAVLATYEGVGVVSRTRPLPHAVVPFTSGYYTKVVAAAERVYLFQKSGIDVFSSDANGLRYVTGIPAPAIVDLAASDSGLFTVSANGTVAAWSRAGTLLSQRALNEGADTQPLAIAVARGAVWVAITTGCSAGACERRTLVLDPATLAVAASLSGAFRDVTVSGTRAYALFDTPDELRVLDLTSPLQPAQIAAIARPASAVSLAYDAGRIHVLADRLYTYNESSLSLSGERFTAVTPDASQRIRVEDGCAVVIGRAEGAELYSLPSFAAAATFSVPSSVRSMATLPGRLFLLTGHSLETWSALPRDTPTKRRSVK